MNGKCVRSDGRALSANTAEDGTGAGIFWESLPWAGTNQLRISRHKVPSNLNFKRRHSDLNAP